MAIRTLQSGKKRNGFLFGLYERLLCLLQSRDHSLDFIRSRPKSLAHDCQAPDKHFNRCSDVQNHSVTLTERLDEKWRTERERINMARLQSLERLFRRDRNDGESFWIYPRLFQRHDQRHVVRTAQADHSKFFSSQICDGFKCRLGDQLEC